MIKLRGITKQFGATTALDDIDLTIDKGEFVAVVGLSGCGKTTLLRIIAGLETPTSGVVQVNGDLPRLACQNHQIGISFQRDALVPFRTASRNVQLTTEITRTHHDPESLLKEFGLNAADFTKYPHQLSGGMRQRVDVACALAHDPPILLLDEPFGPLDEFTREEIGEWLSEVLATNSKTVFFVTHSVEEAVFLADRVVVMQVAGIKGSVEINLRKPRKRTIKADRAYLGLVSEVRRILFEVGK